jgi:hypothetical protein
MTRYAVVLTALIGTSVVALANPQGRGQQGTQQQQQQQQQAQQTQQQQQQQMHMQQMMQRMDQVTARTQALSQSMTKQMDRLRTQDRDQARLLLQLCDAVDAQSRETRRSMDRIHLMMQDPAMNRDQDMQRDMDRLREHLNAVTGGLQEMVGTMEQMQKRMQARIGGGGA